MTLYERLGQREGIREVVDDFYDALISDEELGVFFEGANVETLRKTQTEFLCDAAGGPETYDAAPVREAHEDVPFEPSHIQDAVGILSEVLSSHGVAGEDADAVVEAVTAHEDDLLAED
jgi:hemoglobin